VAETEEVRAFWVLSTVTGVPTRGGFHRNGYSGCTLKKKLPLEQLVGKWKTSRYSGQGRTNRGRNGWCSVRPDVLLRVWHSGIQKKGARTEKIYGESRGYFLPLTNPKSVGSSSVGGGSCCNPSSIVRRRKEKRKKIKENAVAHLLRKILEETMIGTLGEGCGLGGRVSSTWFKMGQTGEI